MELVFARLRNPSAEARWHAVYAQRVVAYRLAYAILGSREHAEDVAEDALLRALESKAEPESMEAWVRTIVVRRALNEKRHAAPSPLSGSEAVERELDGDIAVRATLQRLPAEQRALLALAIGEGLSYRELAEVLGVPEGTVASRLFAAKAAFRREWDQ